MSDHPNAPEPTTLRPGIRTYKPRRSRITRRERAALAAPGDVLLTMDDTLSELPWSQSTQVIMDIGFGAGESTIAMARSNPESLILAIDVHTPGVGRLIADVLAEGVTNVRVLEADALTVLERCTPREYLAGVCTYFPDPWPKARHHKRRIVQPAVLALVHSRLTTGGFWRLATDWPDYADWIVETFAADSGFDGGVIERPNDRPITHYEERALREGRPIVDLEFRTVDAG